ncbi:hypothetical protein CUMW_125470 [Citrus unshiu]|nr:hypothetical protein CUMW_125470 [Citrus unshiu]
MAEDPGESKVIKQLDRTCREAGFFRVMGGQSPNNILLLNANANDDVIIIVQKGHGTPETLIKEAKHIAHNFLDLPCKEKDQDQLTPGAGYRGYQEFEKI